MLPVALVTKTDIDRLTSDLKPLLQSRGEEIGDSSFSIVVDQKNSSKAKDNYGGTGVTREELIKRVAEMMPRSAKVDLKEPDLAVQLLIIKSIACCGILKEYTRLSKYSVHTLAHGAAPQPRRKEPKTDGEGGGKGGEATQPTGSSQGGKHLELLLTSAGDGKDRSFLRLLSDASPPPDAKRRRLGEKE
eukprot:Hpha_TRINITY_DN26463_c0_g1::TRINITY_DN26463_c0_g1_i1::g.34064::m.34064/K06963/TAN1, THUMPD1; tRNA acetyltransferase TAN1